MKFYRFESSDHFLSHSMNANAEFVRDGNTVSVVGLIPAGTESLQWVEVPAPDGGFNLEQQMLPDFLPGWHVNSSDPIDGWEEYLVEPTNPVRVGA